MREKYVEAMTRRAGRTAAKILIFCLLHVLSPSIVTMQDVINKPAEEFFGNLEVNIPGVPGQDYTTFNQPPDSAFSCNAQPFPGYYADAEIGCQVFHICQEGGKHDKFLCPNGTVFNQQYFVCDWWFNFNCDTAAQFYNLNANLYKEMGANLHTKLEQIFDQSFLHTGGTNTLNHGRNTVATNTRTMSGTSLASTVAPITAIPSSRSTDGMAASSGHAQSHSIVLSDVEFVRPPMVAQNDIHSKPQTAATYRLTQTSNSQNGKQGIGTPSNSRTTPLNLPSRQQHLSSAMISTVRPQSVLVMSTSAPRQPTRAPFTDAGSYGNQLIEEVQDFNDYNIQASIVPPSTMQTPRRPSLPPSTTQTPRRPSQPPSMHLSSQPSTVYRPQAITTERSHRPPPPPPPLAFTSFTTSSRTIPPASDHSGYGILSDNTNTISNMFISTRPMRPSTLPPTSIAPPSEQMLFYSASSTASTIPHIPVTSASVLGDGYGHDSLPTTHHRGSLVTESATSPAITHPIPPPSSTLPPPLPVSTPTTMIPNERPPIPLDIDVRSNFQLNAPVSKGPPVTFSQQATPKPISTSTQNFETVKPQLQSTTQFTTAHPHQELTFEPPSFIPQQQTSPRPITELPHSQKTHFNTFFPVSESSFPIKQQFSKPVFPQQQAMHHHSQEQHAQKHFEQNHDTRHHFEHHMNHHEHSFRDHSQTQAQSGNQVQNFQFHQNVQQAGEFGRPNNFVHQDLHNQQFQQQFVQQVPQQFPHQMQNLIQSHVFNSEQQSVQFNNGAGGHHSQNGQQFHNFGRPFIQQHEFRNNQQLQQNQQNSFNFRPFQNSDVHSQHNVQRQNNFNFMLPPPPPPPLPHTSPLHHSHDGSEFQVKEPHQFHSTTASPQITVSHQQFRLITGPTSTPHFVGNQMQAQVFPSNIKNSDFQSHSTFNSQQTTMGSTLPKHSTKHSLEPIATPPSIFPPQQQYEIVQQNTLQLQHVPHHAPMIPNLQLAQTTLVPREHIEKKPMISPQQSLPLRHEPSKMIANQQVLPNQAIRPIESVQQNNHVKQLPPVVNSKQQPYFSSVTSPQQHQMISNFHSTHAAQQNMPNKITPFMQSSIVPITKPPEIIRNVGAPTVKPQSNVLPNTLSQMHQMILSTTPQMPKNNFNSEKPMQISMVPDYRFTSQQSTHQPIKVTTFRPPQPFLAPVKHGVIEQMEHSPLKTSHQPHSVHHKQPINDQKFNQFFQSPTPNFHHQVTSPRPNSVTPSAHSLVSVSQPNYAQSTTQHPVQHSQTVPIRTFTNQVSSSPQFATTVPISHPNLPKFNNQQFSQPEFPKFTKNMPVHHPPSENLQRQSPIQHPLPPPGHQSQNIQLTHPPHLPSTGLHTKSFTTSMQLVQNHPVQNNHNAVLSSGHNNGFSTPSQFRTLPPNVHNEFQPMSSSPHFQQMDMKSTSPIPPAFIPPSQVQKDFVKTTPNFHPSPSPMMVFIPSTTATPPVHNNNLQNMNQIKNGRPNFNNNNHVNINMHHNTNQMNHNLNHNNVDHGINQNLNHNHNVNHNRNQNQNHNRNQNQNHNLNHNQNHNLNHNQNHNLNHNHNQNHNHNHNLNHNQNHHMNQNIQNVNKLNHNANSDHNFKGSFNQNINQNNQNFKNTFNNNFNQNINQNSHNVKNVNQNLNHNANNNFKQNNNINNVNTNLRPNNNLNQNHNHINSFEQMPPVFIPKRHQKPAFADFERTPHKPNHHHQNINNFQHQNGFRPNSFDHNHAGGGGNNQQNRPEQKPFHNHNQHDDDDEEDDDDDDPDDFHFFPHGQNHPMPFQNLISDDMPSYTNEGQMASYAGSDDSHHSEYSSFIPIQKSIAVLRYK